MVGFEIWDTKTGNLLADYDTEADALADLRKAVKTHGKEYVDCLLLVRVGPRGGLTRIAAGAALIKRAPASEKPGRDRIPG